MTVFLVAILSLSLPAEFKSGSNTTERVPMFGPPGRYATQDFRSWDAPGGRSLYLFYWVPSAPRDLGPMKAAAEWPGRVAGQDVTIIETEIFMGRPQRVLVTHLGFKDAGSSAMIYAVGMERKEFEAILAAIRRVAPPQ